MISKDDFKASDVWSLIASIEAIIEKFEEENSGNGLKVYDILFDKNAKMKVKVIIGF